MEGQDTDILTRLKASFRQLNMSLDPPTYLSSLQSNIRTRPIPWEGAVRAGTITDNDLKAIKAVDKVRKEQRRQTVEENLADYSSLILGGSKGKSIFESAAKRADVIQYVLVLTGDLMNGEGAFEPSGRYAALMDIARLPVPQLKTPRTRRPL